MAADAMEILARLVEQQQLMIEKLTAQLMTRQLSEYAYFRKVIAGKSPEDLAVIAQSLAQYHQAVEGRRASPDPAEHMVPPIEEMEGVETLTG